MHYNFSLSVIFLAASTIGGVQADLFYSANDQQSGYAKGEMHVVAEPRQGSISVIDFSNNPPTVINREQVSCSVIGPPTCIAGNEDGSVILVASAMQVDPEDKTQLKPDSQITLLKKDGDAVEILDQISIGLQPSGVALFDEGRKAYVTLRAEGKIALLDLSDGKIKVSGTFTLADPDDSLSHLALSPDGQSALATLHAKNRILVLAVNQDGSLQVTQEIPTAKGPYDVHFLKDGKHAFVACTGEAVLYPLVQDGQKWTLKEPIQTGHIPEGFDISPDEKWLAASCFEGANAKSADSNFGQPARTWIYQIQPDYSLQLETHIPIEGIPQSLAFSKDGRHILAGQFGKSNLLVLELSENGWISTGTVIPLAGQSAAMARGN